MQLPGITTADIFILFYNISKDILFNRAIPIENVILHESPEKIIINLATESCTEVSKSL